MDIGEEKREKMKILLVVTKANLGGAQKRLVDLARFYDKEGHVVTVASGPGEYLPKKLAEAGIEHIAFSYLSRANLLKIVAWWFEFAHLLRARDFDVVHLNSSSALSGALVTQFFSKAKCVFTFRGLSIMAPGYQGSWVKKLFFRISYKLFLPFVDVGVFQCEANQKTAHRVGLRTKKERVIMDGLDTQKLQFLSRDRAREELSEILDTNLQNKAIIGTIGRLAYAKHYDFLIRQMRHIKQTHHDIICVIIGGGPEREKLEALIKELNLQDTVFLTGAIDNAARLIPAFDLFVLTSRYEGLSMTLTEAVMSGVPTLASDVGCARALLSENNVYELRNEDEFVDKATTLLTKEDIDNASGLYLKDSASQYLALYNE